MTDRSILDDPALEPMVMFYAMAAFGLFASRSAEAMRKTAEAAGQISLEHPLFQRNKKGEFDQFELPHIGQRSGPFIAVFMASYLVYAQHINGLQPPAGSSKLIDLADSAYTLWLHMEKKRA